VQKTPEVAPVACVADASAIPWLLLATTPARRPDSSAASRPSSGSTPWAARRPPRPGRRRARSGTSPTPRSTTSTGRASTTLPHLR
jgi:hypothetical protein